MTQLWAVTLGATVALSALVVGLASAPSEPQVIEVTTHYMLVVDGQPIECRRHEDRVAGTITTAC
ncbi:MAG TPA: hypothetical protein VJ396_07060 [Acidiferrobacterales bacterium]|nr:hypothetical protein [Acidiferrobacterales bacterium]